jgi:Xaa-Pro aminopeptidase
MSTPGVAGARRVGVDGGFPMFQALLGAALPDATFVGVEPMMRELRRHKLPDEIASLRIAAAIAESALVAAAREVRPGVSEKHLQAVFLERMCQLGTSQFSRQGTFTVIDPGGGVRWVTGDRVLDEGRLVALAGGALWTGYEGTLARTWWCGRTEPRAEHRALHTRWRDTIGRVIEACRPGRTGADLRAAHDSAGEPLPAMTIAYSVGLGHEGPVAGTSLGAAFDARQRIEAGMVLAVRTMVTGAPGAYLGEEMVLVRDDGPELLTTLAHGPLAT